MNVGRGEAKVRFILKGTDKCTTDIEPNVADIVTVKAYELDVVIKPICSFLVQD